MDFGYQKESQKNTHIDEFSVNSEKSGENQDSGSLKDELSKSIEEGRKKRKQLTLENPEFQAKQNIDDEKQNIRVLNGIRKGVSEQLKLHDLVKLKLGGKEDNNPVHSLFRWIMLIFYAENPDLYSWHEFKKQILEKEKAKDLQHRLALKSCVHLTILEGEKTLYLLNHKDDILKANLKCEECYPLLVKLFDVVELVYKTHGHSRNINKLIDEVVKQEANIKKYNDEIDRVNHLIQEAKSSLRSLESKSLNEDDEIIQQ